MFPPADFLRVALELAIDARRQPLADARSARVRTALGRTYYALYLLVRAEIARRHGIPVRHLQHGLVYTRLQSPLAGDGVRALGRDLERLYTLRQKADYELDPDLLWKEQLDDAVGAEALAHRAWELASALPQLDFSPIVPLLDPRGARGPH
jgi:hypothetical protein